MRARGRSTERRIRLFGSRLLRETRRLSALRFAAFFRPQDRASETLRAGVSSCASGLHSSHRKPGLPDWRLRRGRRRSVVGADGDPRPPGSSVASGKSRRHTRFAFGTPPEAPLDQTGAVNLAERGQEVKEKMPMCILTCQSLPGHIIRNRSVLQETRRRGVLRVEAFQDSD